MSLIEVMVVLAIVGILGALAYSVTQAQKRNVYLRQAAGELVLRTVGLRATALSEGQAYQLVVVDAVGNDASGCGLTNPGACTSYYILSLTPAQAAAWQLGGFDPGSPAAGATLVDRDRFARGVRFLLQDAYVAPPVPFQGVAIFDGNVLGTCANGARCFAVRFDQAGVASAVPRAAGATPGATGFGFVLATDRELDRAGGDRRGVVVGFPSGVVKTWGY